MKKKSAQLVRGHGFGTAPVFLAAISTILGALSVPGIAPKAKPKENRHK